MILVSETQTRTSVIAPSEPATALSFCRSVRINAEPRRILNALTLPEFLEAWLAAPQSTYLLGCTGSALDTLYLDLHAPRSRAVKIALRNIQTATDRFTCQWIKSAYGIDMHSSLDIRLDSTAANCAVTLHHYGFTSMRECQWHSSMWRQSLANLRYLLEPMAPTRSR